MQFFLYLHSNPYHPHVENTISRVKYKLSPTKHFSARLLDLLPLFFPVVLLHKASQTGWVGRHEHAASSSFTSHCIQLDTEVKLFQVALGATWSSHFEHWKLILWVLCWNDQTRNNGAIRWNCFISPGLKLHQGGVYSEYPELLENIELENFALCKKNPAL